MKKIGIILAFIATMNLAACGGRDPSPVMITQDGDKNKSCKTLEFEIKNAQSESKRLYPDIDKTRKNSYLILFGLFLLVPLFFLDFKNAEKTEYEAYRKRYNRLVSIYVEKNCPDEYKNYPDQFQPV